MTEDNHFERFVFAYLELVEQIGAEKQDRHCCLSP
jgi:hypothetical protein